MAATLFGLLLLTFFIGRVMPLDPVLAIVGPECVKTRQNVVGAQRLLSVVGYLAPKSFWLSYGGPD
ncbi:hypothetical protein PSA5_11595 [Pseudomonas syringae pv. actinidiae]|nr:hypothetical protein PSA5_11595 [Pseudomonas syringae pv. actinidiae]